MSMDLSYLLRGYEISNTARVIYGLLDGLSQASARKGKPYTYISRESIAKRVGVCEKTARTALKQLKTVGLITEKRMGRGLNNHIFVFLPKEPQEEKQKKVETADHSIYPAQVQSRTVNNASVNTNTQKVIKSNTDLSVCPANEDKGRTAPKGKPTPRNNNGERQKLRQKYRDYFRKQLKYYEYVNSYFVNYDEANAFSKIIETMANAMSSNGKIYVNGTLLTPQQWFYVAKNITQDQIEDIMCNLTNNIYSIRKPNAYILSCVYNEAMRGLFYKPLYGNA